MATKIIGKQHHQVWRRRHAPLLLARVCRLRRAQLQLLQHLGLSQRCAAHTKAEASIPPPGSRRHSRQDDREDIWGFFVQDDFKLRRNLTDQRWDCAGPTLARSPPKRATCSSPSRRGAELLDWPHRSEGKFLERSERQLRAPDWFCLESELCSTTSSWSAAVTGLNYNQEEIAISSNIVSNPGLVVFPTLSMSTPTSPNPGIIYATAGPVPTHSLRYPANPNTMSTFGPNGLPTTGAG